METRGVSLTDVFATERKYLSLGNFYPSKNHRFWQIIFGFFMLVYSWTEFFSMAAVLFIEKDNMTKLSETLLFCMTQLAFLCKLTNFLMENRKMKEIEQILKHPVLSRLTMDEETIIEEYIIPFKYLSVIYRVLCFLCVLFYGLFPFIDEDPDHMLPLPGWFPFDVKKYQYEIVAAQTAGIGMGAFNNSTLDLLATVLITLGSAQFDILIHKLQHIKKLNTSDAKEALKYCVIYHNLLLEYIAKVEQLFSFGILIQFACSVIVICLTGFQMLVISVKSIQFVLLMIYFSTMTCQIILYCWYGNELMTRSTGLADACYMSEWNDQDKNVCKILFIIMERGKRPVLITAGKLFSLSLTTLMTILKSSYSYFAVLRRIYGKND